MSLHHYITFIHSGALHQLHKLCACSASVPGVEQRRPSLFSPSGARQAVSGRCPAQKLIVCIVYYYYLLLHCIALLLLLDYTCSFIFISRNNKECVYSRCCDFIFIYIHASQIKRNNRVLFIFNQLEKIHVLRFDQHPSAKKVPDNMPFKSL